MKGMRSHSGQGWALAWFGIRALAFTLLAGGVWTVLLVGNLTTTPSIPWSVVVMALLLWLSWQYLGGKWWPVRSSKARRQYRRANPVTGSTFTWALLAGGLAIVALVGLWIVVFQLVKAPGNALPDFSTYPVLTVALVLVMASLVSSIAEEVGIRGYFQVALEREVSGPIAIIISSVVLAPGHGLTQGFVWTTLLFYFLVDMTFGAMAYLTNSILPGILVHGVGLAIFFTLVWPYDQTRRLVWDGGADAWFWLHVVQAIVFTTLAILAFRQLAKVAERKNAVARSPRLW